MAALGLPTSFVAASSGPRPRPAQVGIVARVMGTVGDGDRDQQGGGSEDEYADEDEASSLEAEGMESESAAGEGAEGPGPESLEDQLQSLRMIEAETSRQGDEGRPRRDSFPWIQAVDATSGLYYYYNEGLGLTQ